VRELMRRQLRTALGSALLLLLLIGSLPLAFALIPGLADATVAGIGIAWILLGVLAYPVLLLIGRRQLVRAERNESSHNESRRNEGSTDRPTDGR